MSDYMMETVPKVRPRRGSAECVSWWIGLNWFVGWHMRMWKLPPSTWQNGVSGRPVVVVAMFSCLS